MTFFDSWVDGRVHHSAMLAAVLSACCASAFISCKKDPVEAEPEAANEPTLVLEELPSGVRARDAEFNGKLRILGYKLSGKQGSMRAGRRVTVSLYWQASSRLEPGYKLTTRLLDATGKEILNLDDASPLRRQKDGRPILPPEAWVAGKVYVDELTFTVPENVETWQVRLVSGLAKDSEKLKVTAGEEEAPGLVLVATSGTGVRDKSRGLRRLPSLRVDALDPKTKILIDGKLDEAAWTDAPSARLVDVTTGRLKGTSAVGGSVRLLWNGQGLYVGFDAQDKDVIGGFKKTDKDPHLWTQDTVQIMLDPDGDGDNKDYYEIQINPQNLLFDSHYDDYNQPLKEPDGPFGNQQWSSAVKSAVTIKGTLDKSDDQDEGYVVEAFLPWKSFSKATKAPPALGDTWRMNFYVIQRDDAVAWSPILKQGNFHKASRFGRVLFAATNWEASAPKAASSASAGAPAASAPSSAPSAAPAGPHPED